MLKESLKILIQEAQESLLAEAFGMAQRGGVLSARISDGLLKARAKDELLRIYDLRANLRIRDLKKAVCTCAKPSPCVHIVASLFHLSQVYQHPLPATARSGQTTTEQWLQAALRQIPNPEGALRLIFFLQTIKQAERQSIVLYLHPKVIKNTKRSRINKWMNWSLEKREHQVLMNPSTKALMKTLDVTTAHLDARVSVSPAILRTLLEDHEIYWYKANAEYFDENDKLVATDFEEAEATLSWRFVEDGHYHLDILVEREPVSLITGEQAYALDVTKQRILSLRFQTSWANVLRLQKRTPMPYTDLLENQSTDECGIFAPFMPPKIESCEYREHCIPKVMAFIKRRIAYISENLDASDALIPVDFRLVFDYEGYQVDPHDSAERYYALSPTESGQSRLLVFSRNLSLEREIVESVYKALQAHDIFTTKKQDYQVKPAELVDGWEAFVARLRDSLDALAISLGDESPKVHVLHQDAVQSAQLNLQDTGVQDIFTYEMEIMLDGKKLSLLPWINQLLGQGEKLYRLEDSTPLTLPLDTQGREYIQLPLGFFRPILQVLFSFGLKPNASGEVRLAKTEAMALLRGLQAQGGFPIHLKDKTTLLESLQRIISPSPLDLSRVPPSLAQLRGYQQQGIAWLQALRVAGFGGILADDMGLGKTLQTLLHLAIEKREGRLGAGALVVVPTSIMMNWVLEARRFAPDLITALYYGKHRKLLEAGKVDLWITSYRVARTDIDILVKTEFDYAILDEAQMIKNAKTSSSRSLQAIRAKNRLCLTGTPLENHLGELWALMDFAIPNLLGTYKQFQQYFQYPIEKEANTVRRNALIERIKPFLLRRKKNDVAADLPEKNLIVYPVNFDEQQRMLYEMMRLSLKARVSQALKERGAGQSRIIFLDALLKLRQICCDPRLLNQGIEHHMAPRSAKLEALLLLLESLLAEGRRILIFSQFTSMLKLIEQALEYRRWPYLLLTGQTRNRQELVEQFQQGEFPIFLISLKAGGSGLNLTKADTVIHYDPWWNPAVEMQATDRAHRIGQNKTVFVYKLVCQGSIEEIMMSIQARKQALFDDILSANAKLATELNQETLELFFQPLPELMFVPE